MLWRVTGVSRFVGAGRFVHVLRRPRRNSFDAILEIAERLALRLREQGPDQAIDIDGALQCESFDVIGRVGFNHDFNATDDLSGSGAAGCRTIKEGKGLKWLSRLPHIVQCRWCVWMVDLYPLPSDCSTLSLPCPQPEYAGHRSQHRSV